MSSPLEITIAKSRRRGKRYILELASGEKLRVGEEIVFKHSLFAGKTFAVDRWVAILEEAWEHECYGKLLGMLNRRPHTETEIRRKLYRKGYNKETVAKTIRQAHDVGLIDDGSFARLYVDEKLSIGSQGRRKIIADLRRRGVQQELIDAAFEAFAQTHGEDTEWENILAVAQRKWRHLEREPDPHKRRHKLLSFLANRGFDRSLAYRVLEACTGRSEDL